MNIYYLIFIISLKLKINIIILFMKLYTFDFTHKKIIIEKDIENDISDKKIYNR
jgi:hypothetical protein